jgi:pimeloyl-ACP methyl ester carboxylesterase
MRRLTSAVALLLAMALCPADSGAVAPERPRVVLGSAFVARPCPDDFVPKNVDADCGFIRVPEDRSRPDSRLIKVAAAVVHSTAAQVAPEPILVLPGGPSAGSITGFYYPYYFKNAAWASDHDLVFVDTRGTGISTPRLGCPEVDRAEVDFFYSKPYVGSAAHRIIGGALKECRRHLVRRGIDPAAYTTSASVADLEALRTALGVTQWNLLAVSADGVLGMSYVREHPGSIRSTIVDSGLSPQMVGILDYERGVSMELGAVFRGCAANRACRNRYPHLRQAFMGLVSRLQKHPRVIRLPDFRPHPVSLVIDGAGAYTDAMFGIFPGNRFARSEIPGLLERMWRESHGELVAVYRDLLGTGPETNDHADHFISLGKTMSYECHDVTNFTTRRDLRRAAKALPMYAERYLGSSFDLGHYFASPRSPAGCRIWRVGRAAPEQHQPVASDVPTLVLAGEFDLGVSPYVVRQIDDELTRSTYVEFPASGHLQLASYNVGNRCARAIAASFLRSPLVQPDTSCVDALPAADFTPPVSHDRASPRARSLCRVWLAMACAVEPRSGPQPW